MKTSHILTLVTPSEDKTINSRLFVSAQNLDTLKLQGILEGFGIEYEIEPIKTQNIEPTLPILISSSKQEVSLFWNCIFLLDQTYWNNQLQFGSAKDKEELFRLFEICDFKLFPILCSSYLHSKRSGSDWFKNSYKLSKILQWPFISSFYKAFYSTKYRSLSFSTFYDGTPYENSTYSDTNQSLDIVSKIKSLVYNNSLPELHSNILAYTVNKVLNKLEFQV